ncbi:MAG TPA: NAD-dependent epimerase/dehydratase family protein [Gemmatimonadaceae bacterium]
MQAASSRRWTNGASVPGVALITGAHGFIGRHVARRLKSDGWVVVGVGHGAWTEQQYRAWGLDRWHEATIAVDLLSALGIVPDVIFHCAGTSTVTAALRDPRREFERTVGSTEEVLEAMRRFWPGSLLVYPSSGAVYGEAKTFPIPETEPVAPVSPYGTFKDQAEQLCRLYEGRFGVRSVILRIFSVYGAELRKQLLWDACRKFRSGDLSFQGTGREVRDWVHVDDLARLMNPLISRPDASGVQVINVGTGTGTAVADIVGMIADAVGGGRVACFSGQVRPGDPATYVADIARARAFGWHPSVPLTRGVTEYVQWFLASQAGRHAIP